MLGRHGADDDLVAFGAHPLELGYSRKIDEVRRGCETQLHHRDEAVAAGERTAIVAELCQQTNSIFDGCRAMIGESAWYHWASSLAAVRAGQGRHRGRGPSRNTFKDSNSGELCAAAAIIAALGADECTKGGFACMNCGALARIASTWLTQSPDAISIAPRNVAASASKPDRDRSNSRRAISANRYGCG